MALRSGACCSWNKLDNVQQHDAQCTEEILHSVLPHHPLRSKVKSGMELHPSRSCQLQPSIQQTPETLDLHKDVHSEGSDQVRGYRPNLA